MNMYDSAIKVPFLISWPGQIPMGDVCREEVSACDLFPTLLELTDMTDQLPQGLPGKSICSLLRGGLVAAREEVIIYGEYGPVRMIRTKQWKYVHRYPYGKHEFYNLEDDPGETKNLYGCREYEALILKMKFQMEQWFLHYTDARIDGSKEGVTGSGQLCRAGIYAVRTDVYAPVGS